MNKQITSAASNKYKDHHQGVTEYVLKRKSFCLENFAVCSPKRDIALFKGNILLLGGRSITPKWTFGRMPTYAQTIARPH